MTEEAICCICSDSVGLFGLVESIQLTEVILTACCAEPVCGHCQADLELFGRPQCLRCGQELRLAEATLITDSCLEVALTQLSATIQLYDQAIVDIRTRLSDYDDNLVTLLRLAPEHQIQPVQEAYKQVIKPLQVSLHGNKMMLNYLQYLGRRLEIATKPVSGQLINSVSSATSIPITKPSSLPLWHFRHPLGWQVTSRQPFEASSPTKTVVDDHLILLTIARATGQPEDSLETIIRYINYTIDFQEITPGYFLLLVTYYDCCYIFTLQASLIMVIPDCVTDSVRINAKYLVWQDLNGYKNKFSGVDKGITYCLAANFTQPELVNLHTLITNRRVIATDPVKIFTLEDDQLWCRYYYAGLSSFDLSAPVAEPVTAPVPAALPANIAKDLSIVINSYHRGIYCGYYYDGEHKSNIHYVIGSLAYPQTYLKTECSPHLYDDGTVIYHNGQEWLICQQEDLSGSRPLNQRPNTIFDSVKTILSSDCRVMTWSKKQTRSIYFTSYD